MVAIPKRRETELTGRVRVRVGWFRRLILQVEVRTTVYSAWPPMPGRDPRAWRDLMRSEGQQYFTWRDAEWDDVHTQLRLDLAPEGLVSEVEVSRVNAHEPEISDGR